MIGDFVGDFIFLFMGACFYGLCFLFVLVGIYMAQLLFGFMLRLFSTK